MGTFQLTRPRKARPVLPFPLQTYHHFNSRAHARRDGSCRTFPMFHGNFNSRAHARRDEICQILDNVKIKFQLTRPRKARPYNSTHKIPHPHISTHAPTQGATSTVFILFVISIFQLTRPRKARLRSWFISRNSITFQLTRPRKARRQSKL